MLWRTSREQRASSPLARTHVAAQRRPALIVESCKARWQNWSRNFNRALISVPDIRHDLSGFVRCHFQIFTVSASHFLSLRFNAARMPCFFGPKICPTRCLLQLYCRPIFGSSHPCVRRSAIRRFRVAAFSLNSFLVVMRPYIDYSVG